AVLLLGIAIAPALLRAQGAQTDAGFALDYLVLRAGEPGLSGRLPKIVWWEWVVGLAPTTLVLLWLGRRRALRGPALAAALAILPLAGVAWAMLSALEIEYGAYLVTAAWPAVAV